MRPSRRSLSVTAIKGHVLLRNATTSEVPRAPVPHRAGVVTRSVLSLVRPSTARGSTRTCHAPAARRKRYGRSREDRRHQGMGQVHTLMKTVKHLELFWESRGLRGRPPPPLSECRPNQRFNALQKWTTSPSSRPRLLPRSAFHTCAAPGRWPHNLPARAGKQRVTGAAHQGPLAHRWRALVLGPSTAGWPLPLLRSWAG